MQTLRPGLKLLRAVAICSITLCTVTAVYMSTESHYDEALTRVQSSAGIFILFIVVSIGVTLALASFVSNLVVGQNNREDRVLLAMKLKEFV